MASERSFVFNGIVESIKFKHISAAVFLPHHVTLSIPHGRVKVRGIINGVTFSVSVFYRKEAGRFFPINHALLKAAGLEPGDSVDITFTLIPSGKAEIPPERETVLGEHNKSKKIWRRLSTTAGQVVAGYFTLAKSIDSRLRCSLEKIQRSKVVLKQTYGAKRAKRR